MIIRRCHGGLQFSWPDECFTGLHRRRESCHIAGCVSNSSEKVRDKFEDGIPLQLTTIRLV